MRAFAAAAAALCLLGAAAPAVAGVLVLGQSRAAGCSRAAVTGARDGRSLDLCSRALAEDALTARDRAATYVNRGVLHFRRGENAEALADFERAMAVDPRLGEAYVNRGSVNVRQGRYEAGMADIDRGLALGVKQPERAYFIRGAAREALDDLAGAYRDFRKAAELNPKWEPARAELARFTVRPRP